MPVGLVVDIKGDTSNLDSALDKSKGGVSGFGGALGALAGPAGIAAAGVSTAVVAVAAMTKAAADDRDEQAKLEQAITAAGAATATSTQQVEDAIAAGQDRAFSDSETRAGLEALVVATGDVGQATDLLAVAQDVARKSGVSLEDASKAVAKAQAGQDGALRKLIPGLAKGAKASDTIALASKAAAGQADLYANSAEGMGARGKDAFAEIGETVGSAFLPIMDEVVPALIPIIKQFGQLISAILPVLIPLVKILATALGLVVRVLSTVVGWLIQLISWMTKAISMIGKFLDKLNPLKGFKMPSLPFLNSSAAFAAPSGASTRGARSSGSGSSGGITINVSGAIDPEATARQIRRILNGHTVRTGAAAI